MMSNPLAPEWLDYPADVNAIEEKVWPRHVKRRPTGELEIAGVAVTEIVAQFGTPLYVIDEDDFRARATAAKTALGDAANLFQPGDHGSTFGGNPVATAAGLAVIETIEKSDLLKRVNSIGLELMADIALIEGVEGIFGDHVDHKEDEVNATENGHNAKASER